ncbi:MAG: hypothetical protein ACYDGY_01155 [Acidimicrobiales bacterium]
MKIGMERTLVVVAPALLVASDPGYRSVASRQILDALAAVGPFAREVGTGVYASAVRRAVRYFGGEAPFALATRQAVEDAVGHDGIGSATGVADGMVAAFLAACTAVGNDTVVVPQRGVPAFLAPLPVNILAGDSLRPNVLGVATLGNLAALPERDVLNRFGRDILYCQQIATGKQGELTPAIHASIMSWLLAGLQEGKELPRAKRYSLEIPSQQDEPSNWRDEQAYAAINEVFRSMGYGSVRIGKLRGGRYPAERAEQVAWIPQEMSNHTHISSWHEQDRNAENPAIKELQVGTPRVVPLAMRSRGQDKLELGPLGMPEAWPDRITSTGPEPAALGTPEAWPGYLPAPSPIVLHKEPAPVIVSVRRGEKVQVCANGEISGEPYLLALRGNARIAISSWAGPWIYEGRWWEQNIQAYSQDCRASSHAGYRSGRRSQSMQSMHIQSAFSILRQARIQVATASGIGYLLLEEGDRWYIEATYD